uniref:Immunoglobulin V-set domain-containing protein n=1 Tax=Acanthochromis polyacanthus TaxID=80966 RepID=A0A3Q1G8S4_9TELE
MIVTVHLRSITANHLSAIALSGIHCEITTVNKVPVKAGDSISVPCLYEQKYEDHVKYLCKGNPWLFCQIVITTNQQPCSERFCISDDTIQRIFTVTINNVTDEDKVFCVTIVIAVTTTLFLALVVVPAACFGCRMIMRSKSTLNSAKTNSL